MNVSNGENYIHILFSNAIKSDSARGHFSIRSNIVIARLPEPALLVLEKCLTDTFYCDGGRNHAILEKGSVKNKLYIQFSTEL